MKQAFALFLAVTGCAYQPAHGIVELRIDRQAIAPHPYLKTKLGVARASGFQELPRTFPAMAEIGARAFCTTISFDEVSDRNRENYALGSSQFSTSGVTIDPIAMNWLASVQHGSARLGLATYIGLVGAPKPYQVPVIRKPAAHPTPTNIDGAARLTADWVRQTFQVLPNVNWVIWNEPEHTLRGTNSLVAAYEMANIYRSYVQQLDPIIPREGFGLAAFMKASLRPSSDDRAHTFFQNVVRRLGEPNVPRIDYITMNNYHGKTDELYDSLDLELTKRGMDQPLLFTQYAPSAIGEQPSLAGTNEAAALYLTHLNRFVETPGLGVTCFSFWAGSDRKALLRLSPPSETFWKSPAFQAIAFYQRLPLWRLEIPPLPANSGLVVWGGVQDDQFGILIAHKPIASVPVTAGRSGSGKRHQLLLDRKQGTDVPPKGERKVVRKADRKTLRKTNRQPKRESDGQRSSAHSAEQATPISPHRGESIAFVLPGLAGKSFNLERLRSGQAGVAKERVTVDAQERLTVSLNTNDIVFIATENTVAKPIPLRPMRQDLYVHRRNLSGQMLPPSQQGVASMDPIHDGFVLSVPGPESTAHASATFGSSRSSLSLHWGIPPNSDLASAQKCSAALVQYLNGDQVVGTSAWGSADALKRIMLSRAFSAIAGGGTSAPQPWPASDGMRMLLSLNSPSGVDGIRLHLGMGGCSGFQQAQILPQS